LGGNKTLLIVAIAVLVTALVVFMAVDSLRAQKIEGLERQLETLENENAELNEQIAVLQEQTKNKPGEGKEISRAPRPGWEAYFPNAETTTLLNEPVDKVRSLLGEPPVLLRSIAANPAFNREIWIYMPGEEDPTGLYIYFKGDRVFGSRLDEFNGLYNSGLLDDEDFWLLN
jgi:hypothetical protein